MFLGEPLVIKKMQIQYSIYQSFLEIDCSELVLSIIPNDALWERRAINLKKSSFIIIAKKENMVVGLLFARRIFGLLNATWIVGDAARRQGIGDNMLKLLEQNVNCITAICRNLPSLYLAKNCNFFTIGRFAIWIKFFSNGQKN